MAASRTHDNLSLYVHIPFCNSKCDYCDFASFAGVDCDARRRTVARIVEELHERACANSGPELTEAELFRQVHESIDYSSISNEFHERTKDLLEDVADKAALDALKGAGDL